MLLIVAQKPDARQCAGLKTWNRLGRYVRKGEHGIAILAPCVKRRKSDRESAEPSGDVPAEHAAGDTAEVVVGFRGAYVFDVTQTDGAPVAEFATVSGDPGRIHGPPEGHSPKKA